MASLLRLPTSYVNAEPATPLTVLELPVHEPQSYANRRTLPRLCARFEVRPHDGADVFAGVDLSFGGLMCVADEPVWPGNAFAFDLCLPGEPKPLELIGRVVELVSYKGRLAMRVRFDDAPMAARKRIAAFMARLRS